MMELWVVMGQYGEYEDTCYWAVAAYTNPAEAEAHAERANEWWKAAKVAHPPHEHTPRTTPIGARPTQEEMLCLSGRCAHPGTNPFDSIGIPDNTAAQMRTPGEFYEGCSGDWYYVEGPIPLVNKPC